MSDCLTLDYTVAEVAGGWALDRVHNSCRPVARLQYGFALYDPVIS